MSTDRPVEPRRSGVSATVVGMASTTRHLGEKIDRPAGAVYDYVVDPTNLPTWASGLSSAVTQVDGEWLTDSPMGRVKVEFAPRNEFGVLDHTVTLPTGQAMLNPLRVIPDGDGCEIVFAVLRRPEVTDTEFDQDVAAVAADLAALKQVLENRG
jgi:hypothetical protein